MAYIADGYARAPCAQWDIYVGERQNFRVRGSGGDAVFRPAARWLRPPFPVTVTGIMRINRF
jgi:hypothetical protein